MKHSPRTHSRGDYLKRELISQGIYKGLSSQTLFKSCKPQPLCLGQLFFKEEETEK